MTRTTVASLALAVAFTGLGAGAALAAPAETTPGTALSADAKADIAFAREEERLARDIYAYIADKYDGARPFSNITVSEDRHYETVGVILERYGLADPSEGRAAGSYADPELQKLWDTLTKQADVSLAEAYKVGIAVEERDIADLKSMENTSLPSDVSGAYAALLRASEFHLKAFTAAADGQTLGAGAGTGLQNGRGGAAGPAAGAGMGRGGWGGGAAAGGGFGPGAGVGAGVPGTNPDCPLTVPSAS